MGSNTKCSHCNWQAGSSPCSMCKANIKYREEHKEEIAARNAALPVTKAHCGHDTRVNACICCACILKGVTHTSLGMKMCVPVKA